jgi:hypothetical protein
MIDDFRRNIRPRTGWLRRDGDDRPWLGSTLSRRAPHWSEALRNIQDQQSKEQKPCSTA